MGLSGYYCVFVRNHASIASPLTRLLKKDIPFSLNGPKQQSFDTLKHALTHVPVLSFSDYQLPCLVETDVSSFGVCAILIQSFGGKRSHVIAYASRVLIDVESRYSVTYVEALAVVWGFKHFKEIIYGYPITVYTDHTAVTNIFKSKNLEKRVARWYITSGI